MIKIESFHLFRNSFRTATLARWSALCLVPIAMSSWAQSEEESTEPDKPAPPTADQRPPGGNGDMFYQVFVSRSDQNGDGVIEKSEFRGGAARFDQMDENQNGKLDRAEIDKLHRSRMADPLSMRQRVAKGETRRPRAGLPQAVAEAAPGAGGAEPESDSAEPTALTPLGTRITAKDAFARLDVDKDGRVTPTEFRRSPGMSGAIKAQEVVTKIDQDEDGVLSFTEFNTVFAKRHSEKSADE
ncbi:MAG: Ca2+-binding EF-hand superfamily protein [Verrucomicrobiales bacterium]|jgi:Ca2+-binding EF-hand superfamily protein